MFARIVVGTDGSETAKEAVRQAADLARKVGARLDVVTAYEPVPQSRLREERRDVPADLAHTVNPKEDVEGLLKEVESQVAKDGVAVATYARQGDPADAILDVAEEQRADLII